MKIELSGNPATIKDLKEQLSSVVDPKAAAVSTRAPSRDFSVLEIVLTTVIGGAAKLVFEMLAMEVKKAWANKKSQDALVARIGNETIEIKTEADLERLKRALNVQ
jgi:hypothetical protein